MSSQEQQGEVVNLGALTQQDSLESKYNDTKRFSNYSNNSSIEKQKLTPRDTIEIQRELSSPKHQI